MNRLTYVLLIPPEDLESVEDITVVVFKKYTSKEYIKIFFNGLGKKWDKRFRPTGTTFNINHPGSVGMAYFLLIEGENISQIKQDLRLNPRILFVGEVPIPKGV